MTATFRSARNWTLQAKGDTIEDALADLGVFSGEEIIRILDAGGYLRMWQKGVVVHFGQSVRTFRLNPAGNGARLRDA
jgi:hypothetical protein